jgi:pimeloyl-ACP methyl ester carboxylesterase
LWYEDTEGPGVPVIFVHPAATHSGCWVNQIPAFTAAGFRCITYDLRGWHRSRSIADADPGALSDDLEALREALQLEAFVLIAAAYGGFGGADYALRFPDRLRALVLATTQGGVVDPQYVAVRERAVSPEIRALPVYLRELGPSYRAEDSEGVARWMDIERESHAAARQRLHLQIDLAMLENLRVPTLFVAGGADLLAPPALMRMLAQRIPDARFETIAEAGHSAHWERPAEWNEIVLGFLRRQLVGA